MRGSVEGQPMRLCCIGPVLTDKRHALVVVVPR